MTSLSRRRLQWLARQSLLLALSSFAEAGQGPWWGTAFGFPDQLGSGHPQISSQNAIQDSVIWEPHGDSPILWSYPDTIEIVHHSQRESPSVTVPHNQKSWTRPPVVITRYGPPPPPRTTPSSTTTPSPNRGTEVEDPQTLVPPRYKPGTAKDEPLQLRTISELPKTHSVFDESVLNMDAVENADWSKHLQQRRTGYVPAVRRDRIEEIMRTLSPNYKTEWPEVSKRVTWIKSND